MKIISIEYCTQSPDELIIEIKRPYWLLWSKTETFTVKYDQFSGRFYYTHNNKYLPAKLSLELYICRCNFDLQR